MPISPFNLNMTAMDEQQYLISSSRFIQKPRKQYTFLHQANLSRIVLMNSIGNSTTILLSIDKKNKLVKLHDKI